MNRISRIFPYKNNIYKMIFISNLLINLINVILEIWNIIYSNKPVVKINRSEVSKVIINLKIVIYNKKKI